MVFTRFPWRAPSFLQHGRRTPFFPVSSRSRFLARVPVRASAHSTHMVFPCFPWCAPSFLQHGRPTRFSRFLTFTFFGPCARTCIRPCHEQGFHPFSMARPVFCNTAPYPFFPFPHVHVFWPVCPYVHPSMPRTWFSPVFHGARPVLCNTAVVPRSFPFPQVHVFCHVCPYVNPSMPRTWFSPVFHGARPFFATRPPCPFFPVSSRSRFLARVPVRASVHDTHMVCPSFPWCAPSLLQHGPVPVFPVSSRSRFLARVPVRASFHATHKVFTRFPWCAPSFLQNGRHTPCFPVSSSSRFLARVPVRSSVHATHMVFTRFPWRAPSFLQHGRRTPFPRVHVFSPVCPYVHPSIPRTLFSPVFHGARPVFCNTAALPVFRCAPCHRTWFRRCAPHGYRLFIIVRVQFLPQWSSYPFFAREPFYTFMSHVVFTCSYGASTVIFVAWHV